MFKIAVEKVPRDSEVEMRRVIFYKSALLEYAEDLDIVERSRKATKPS